jgi:hypothetical protein
MAKLVDFLIEDSFYTKVGICCEECSKLRSAIQLDIMPRTKIQYDYSRAASVVEKKKLISILNRCNFRS